MASGTTKTATDSWKKNVLLNYKRLVHETDLYDAVDDCFSMGIFREEEKDDVQSERIKHEKNRQFLNLLLRKPRNVFDQFLESYFVNKKQNVHIKELLECASGEMTKPKLAVSDPRRRRQIFRNYVKIVDSTSLRYMIDDFIVARVFDIEDWENIRKNCRSISEENRRFLNTLLTKSCGHALLLEMLREAHHAELATSIEQDIADERIDEEIKKFLERNESRVDDNVGKTAEDRLSKLKKRLQSHYEDYTHMEACEMEKIVRIFVDRGMISNEESIELLPEKSCGADEMLRKRKTLEMLSNSDNLMSFRIFFNRAVKYEKTTNEENKCPRDEYLGIKIQMNKEKILEEDIDVDVILDRLISSHIINIGNRYIFDHDNIRCKKENDHDKNRCRKEILLNILLEKETGWETVLVEYLENFGDIAYNIINTDPGYQDWQKNLRKNYSSLLKKDLQRLITTCEDYNIISSTQCSELTKQSREDCNRDFLGLISKAKKVKELRLVFYEKERDLMKEIDGKCKTSDTKPADEMFLFEKRVKLNMGLITQTAFDVDSMMKMFIEEDVLNMEDALELGDKTEEDKRRAILKLLFETSGGWGKHLKEHFEDNKLLSLVESLESTDLEHEDGTLPEEILQQGPDAVEAYKLAIQNGVEKRHHARIMVVGAHGVGKSTLVNAIFKRGYDVTQIEQTDGIDIHKNHCAICINSGEWKFQQDFLNLLTDAKNRKVKAVIAKKGNDDVNATEAILSEDVNNKTDKGMSTGYSDETRHVKQTEKRQEETISEEVNQKSAKQRDVSEEVKFTEKKTTERKEIESVRRRDVTSHERETYEKSIKKHQIKLKTHEEEIKELTELNMKQLPRDHCLVTIWDFGGHYVFYSTHQTFLSRRAIYLIVLNISRDLSKAVKELDENIEKQSGFKLFSEEDFFRFWLHSIICYGSTDPSILVFLTHIDKLKLKEKDKKIRLFVGKLKSIAQKCSLDLQDENIVTVNATKPCDDPEFDKIRRKLFEVAKKQKYWGENTPASYIRMEEYLLLQKKEKIERVENIIPVAQEVFTSDVKMLDTFLKYQHEIGNLIYFEEEELNEFIILNPKTLIDAFKRIFTFLKKDESLEEFERSGKIRKTQIVSVWKSEREEEDLSQYTEYLLGLFTKLGIIVKRIQDNKDITYFFAPCKLKKKIDPAKFERMITQSKNKSPILCFTSEKKTMNKYISPAATNKLLTSCIGKWGEVVQNEESGELMIYCDGIVLRIEGIQLLVAVIDGVILICATSPEKSNFHHCPEIRRFFHQTVNKINKDCSDVYKLKEYVNCIDSLHFSEAHNYPVKINRQDLEEVSSLMVDPPLMKCEKKHDLNTKDVLHIWGIDPEEENKMSKFSRLLVAAIDFGTTYSGYAFSFKSDYESDPTKISSNNWTAGSRGQVSLKTPTTVLFDQHKKFHSFGFQAEDKYSELAEDDQHHGWYYFRRFKMMLFDQIGLKKTVMVKDINGRELPAQDVFSAAISYLKGHLMDTLNKRATGVQEEDIQWVLTVPAIWNDAAKQFMRLAAEKAGIESEQLSIALEPEAASMYCKHIPVELVSGDDPAFSPFSPGSKYLVLDAGGGIVDITIHEVKHNGSLKELHKASGGAWGGTQVDESFRQFLVKIVGGHVLTAFREKHTSDYINMYREFETKKRIIKGEIFEKITIKIPISLKELFKEETGEHIKEALEQTPSAGKVQWVGGKVRIHSDVLKTFFKMAVENIIQHVTELFCEKEAEDATIILMVGGFSESPLLQERVRSAFPSPQYRIIIPQEAGLAVLKGAVLFGHCPQTIASRIAKFTYGVSTTRMFDKNTHPEEKKKKYGNDYRCVDIFSRHVEKGQTLIIDEAQSEQRYTPVNKDQKSMLFYMYTSQNHNPRFVTDPDCQFLGKLEVDMSNLDGGLNRAVFVKIIFGGTEIKAEAREESTGRVTKAKFDFLE